MEDHPVRSRLTINGRELPDTGDAIRIGRDPRSHIQFEDERVSRNHALIEPAGLGWVLRDASSRGTFDAGTRITSVRLQGSHEFRLADPEDGPVLSVSVTPVPEADLPAPPAAEAQQTPRNPQTIRVGDRTFGVEDGPIVIGRNPDATIVVDDARVSRAHARIEHLQEGWILQDSSRQGTYVDGERAERMRLSGSVELRLADPVTGPALPIVTGSTDAGPGTPVEAQPLPSRLGRLSGIHGGRGGALRIGRAPDNDVVLNDLRVSRHHAELVPTGGGHELHDLGSHNGTFVNGSRVDHAPLADGDLVSVGAHVFRFVAGNLEEYEDRGEAWLLAHGLTVTTDDGRRILDEVNLALPPSTLLAVVGPSGSGKTTLLNALAGSRPAEAGGVQYGGRDLYVAYEDMRQNMGLVPQSDIIHTELTVRTALNYAAALRFPADVDAPARRARVEEVIAELGLAHRADTRIERLSGGQRKRVSVALELLTKPSLLFLDEPTSGLDPANEDQVVSLLEALADDGRIVVVATHSIETLRRADRVLFMAPGGHLAFYGTPDEALAYFAAEAGLSDFSAIFRRLEDEPDARWTERYAATDSHEHLVRRPLAQAQISAAGGQRSAPAPPRPRVGRARQLGILVSRYLSIIASDRRNLLITIAQAPFFGLLIAAIFIFRSNEEFACARQPNGMLLVWLMVVGATWLGASNAIREIVKELPIYRRERSVGLSLSAYIGSKALVLGSITLAQAAVLVIVVLGTQRLPAEISEAGVCADAMLFSEPSAALGSPALELVIGVGLGGVAAMTLALLLSSLVTRADKAAALLPYLLIVQILLSQPFIPTPELDPIEYAASARWSVAAAASTLDLNRSRTPYLLGVEAVRDHLGSTVPPTEEEVFDRLYPDQSVIENGFSPDPLWIQSAATWLVDTGVLVIMSLLALLGAALALRRHDTGPLGNREASRVRRLVPGPASRAAR